jgi:hypothetical protein
MTRTEDIEGAVSKFLKGQDLSVIPTGQVVGVGNTQRLEFEYDAYVFGYRCTLEQLVRHLFLLVVTNNELSSTPIVRSSDSI